MTEFWCEALAPIAPTHLVTCDPEDFPEGSEAIPDLAGRAMLVRRAEMLPLECIVRGYITGSAWKEYTEHGTMHGHRSRAGLLESDQLPEPVFTPSTKATEGHDVNISYEQAADLVGEEVAACPRDLPRRLRGGAAIARERGIVIADTKFELGIIDGELAICDEILTPDSSRFWPADAWKPGAAPPSFDKQPVRDWAESTGWDKAPRPRRSPPR
jgi:phosphoribosylaminoimidazole-succinocarboxamide synthase